MANQITPNPSVPSQVVAEVKFPKFINNLGIIPTSYKDSMSYYETLAWVCKFLEEQVIPTVNENGEAVEELQALYVELNSYVTHYFDTLDVQEEINNKLDDMVEAGTLEEIISAYLNSTAIFGYDNVEDMTNATNLINGSYAKTLGYYQKNDGGSGLYKIRTRTFDDQIDNGFIILLENENLVAELICNNSINIKQIGAHANGIDDDTNYFSMAINYLKQKFQSNLYGNNSILYLPNGKYKVTETIQMPLYLKIKSLDNVIIYSYISNDATFEIFADDNIPNLPIDFINNYFNFNKDISPIIDGSLGGISIINMIDVEKDNDFLISSAGYSTAIKIGKNTNNLNANYSLKNILISNFNIGIIFFTKNNYLSLFENISLFENNYAIVYGDGTVDENSGEMIRFQNCNISNNRIACEIKSYGSLNFNDSSFDYNQLCYLLSNPTGASININSCHHEGFYSKQYIEDNNKNNLIDENYYGLVLFNRTTNNFYYSCNVLFNNSSISANRGSANIIRAISNSSYRNCVSFNHVRLSGLFSPNTSNYKRFLKNKNSICNQYVTVINSDIIPSYNRQTIMCSSFFNLINDSFNDSATVGDIGNYYSNTVIGNIKILESYGGTTYEIITDQALNNGIKLSYDNERLNGDTIFFQANNKIPCSIGSLYTTDGILSNIESGVITKGIRIYDENDALLSEVTLSDNQSITIDQNTYRNIGNEVFYINDPKAKYFIPNFKIKINYLENAQYNYFEIFNLQCYKLS